MGLLMAPRHILAKDVLKEKMQNLSMRLKIMTIVNSIALMHAIVALLEDFQKAVTVRRVAGVQKDGTKKRKREIQIQMKLNIEI